MYTRNRMWIYAAIIVISVWFLTLLVHAEAMAAPKGKGMLYLVGMGPGDPDLATVKAMKVVKEADRVFCFDYMKETVAPYVKQGALVAVSPLLLKKFYGKDPAQFQGKMREKCAESARRFTAFAVQVRKMVAAGKTVAFVDSGDPLIFGAWAWVTEEFEDLGPVVIPGISSFNAGNAALKRDMMWGSRSLLLTAGPRLGNPDEQGRMSTPLVFFTHKMSVRELVPQLLARYPSDTPITIVCYAGYAEKERVISATLATILDVLGDEELPYKHLIYVGDILTLKHKK